MRAEHSHSPKHWRRWQALQRAAIAEAYRRSGGDLGDAWNMAFVAAFSRRKFARRKKHCARMMRVWTDPERAP